MNLQGAWSGSTQRAWAAGCVAVRARRAPPVLGLLMRVSPARPPLASGVRRALPSAEPRRAPHRGSTDSAQACQLLEVSRCRDGLRKFVIYS
jgi:hypothetical protein